MHNDSAWNLQHEYYPEFFAEDYMKASGNKLRWPMKMRWRLEPDGFARPHQGSGSLGACDFSWLFWSDDLLRPSAWDFVSVDMDTKNPTQESKTETVAAEACCTTSEASSCCEPGGR